MSRGQFYPLQIILLGTIISFVLFVIMVNPHYRNEMLREESGDVTIHIKDGKIVSKKEINVFLYTTVLWINDDSVEYTLSFADEKGTIGPHGSYVRKFTNYGTYVYSTEENPGICGRIKVSQSI